MSPCQRCGGVLDIVDADPPDGGRFVERYECDNCGATGRVTGDGDRPASEWSRYGPAFDGGRA